MAQPKRTAFQRESDLEKISSLYLRGWRQADIAVEIGLSRQQVGYDLKTIQERWRTQTAINLDEAKQRELARSLRWRTQTAINLDEAKQRELARIDELEREYWQAWETSKGERTKARQEKNVTGAVTKASMEKEQRDGNPAFLAGVMTCIDRRCKLLGLDAPIRTQNIEIDLSKLTDDQLARVANGEDVMQVVLSGYVATASS